MGCLRLLVSTGIGTTEWCLLHMQWNTGLRGSITRWWCMAGKPWGRVGVARPSWGRVGVVTRHGGQRGMLGGRLR